MNRELNLPRTIRSLWRLLRGKPVVPQSLSDNQMLRLIYHRRSVRSFAQKPISDDEMYAILEAGRLAPSTVNLQSWTFSVFDPISWKKTFRQALPFRASRAVIIIADTYRYRTVLPEFPDCPLTEYTTSVMNASLAAMNMNLAAEALGISSVMLSETGRSGLLDAQYIREKLGLPDGLVPLMTIVFGYARELNPPMPPKFPMSEILMQGKYHPPDRDVLYSWLDQMTAGYNVSHPGSSFRKQLQVYQSKIEQAEKDLVDMVFHQHPPVS